MGDIGSFSIDDERMEGIVFAKVEVEQAVMIAVGINILQLADEPFQRHVATVDTGQAPFVVVESHGKCTDIVLCSNIIEVGTSPDASLFLLGLDIPVMFQVVVIGRADIPYMLLINVHIGLKPLRILREVTWLEPHKVALDVIVELDLFLQSSDDRLG